jgi:hypothetical protein
MLMLAGHHDEGPAQRCSSVPVALWRSLPAASGEVLARLLEATRLPSIPQATTGSEFASATPIWLLCTFTQVRCFPYDASQLHCKMTLQSSFNHLRRPETIATATVAEDWSILDQLKSHPSSPAVQW